MADVQLIGICGSLRAASLNAALLEAAVGLVPDDAQLDIYTEMRDLPLYDQDLDDAGAPGPVAELRDRVSECQGLVIATPEYNYGVPGGLKNLIDWLSRPVPGAALYRKPIAIMGASPSPFGTVRAQLALRQCFLWTDSEVIRKPEVMVFNAGERISESGELTDQATADFVALLLSNLVDHIRRAGVVSVQMA